MKILLIYLLAILFLPISVFAQDNLTNNIKIKTSKSPYQSHSKIEQELKKLQGKKVDSFANLNKGQVSSVQFQNLGDDNFQFTFTANKQFIANLRMLNYPYRLVIDINQPYQWKVPITDIKKIPITVIQGIRYGAQADKTFRIVLDLSKNFVMKKASIKAINQHLFKMTIVLNKSANIMSTVTLANTVVFVENANLLKTISNNLEDRAKDSIAVVKNDNQKLREYLSKVTYKKPYLMGEKRKHILIMIDPGHGGKDPGASNLNKTLQEKDIILNVSKALSEKLVKNKEISVVLSRDADYYVPLQDRLMWAKFLGVDLFVSIHADAATNYKNSSGMSVYTLSEISSDVQAQLLANDANKSDLIAGVKLSRENEEVNQVLARLSQRLKQNDSVLLAKSIINYSSRNLRILNTPIRSANFAVLKVPNTASVLVELGFLSNEIDLREFKDSQYKFKVANSLSLGIQYYLWDKGLLTNFPSSAYYNNNPTINTSN